MTGGGKSNNLPIIKVNKSRRKLRNSIFSFLRYSIFGGILIEFAFSIPILISLLFFVCDHYRFYELKNKLKSSAYLAASMVQQLTNTRIDKQLTVNDLRRITYACCLNLFHTNAMFDPYPLGIYFSIGFNYVKKLNNGNYLFQNCWSTTYGTSPNTMDKYFAETREISKDEVRSISPDLICDTIGEERLQIAASYKSAYATVKNKLGLFILEPKHKGGWASGQHAYLFEYSPVITPKPGLFPVKNE